MKRLGIFLLIIISISFIQQNSFCQEGPSYFAEYVPGEVIVKFKPDAFNEEGELISESIKALNEEYGLVSMEPVFTGEVSEELKFIYKLDFGEEQDVIELIEAYSSDASVIYAEPNYIAHITE